MLSLLFASLARAAEPANEAEVRAQLIAAQRHLAEALLVVAGGTETATRLLPLAGTEPLTVIRADVADAATARRELASYGLRCAALVEPNGAEAWTVSLVGDCEPSGVLDVVVESDGPLPTVESPYVIASEWVDIPIESAIQKRAFVVREVDGEWGVYRYANGDAVTARTLARAARDEPLAARFRGARVGAFVGGGLIAGSGAVFGLFLVAVARWTGDDSQFILPAVGATSLVLVGVALPMATILLQNDLHTYYDEDSARAAVEAYNDRLREESRTLLRRSLHLTPVLTPGGLAVVGSF